MNFFKLYFALSIICLIVGASPAQSATIHVPADQPTIQAGIDAAVIGDTVLVADGTYTGNGNRDIDFGGKGVVLKSENGPDVTIIDCEGTSADPHRGFYFHSGEDSTAVVDGFTIQGGYGLFDGPLGSSVGGGIKCESSSSPKIINNIIRGNSAIGSVGSGGGIYCSLFSKPTINNNTISNNSADQGGGIACDRSRPTISNNTISENSALSGGGIYCVSNANPTMSDNTISGNSANFGAGISCAVSSNPTISNNIISGNSANGGGGGIYFISSSPTISNNIISGNSAINGGGISCRSSSATISNNTISGNSAVLGGGGIYCLFHSSPTITNNTISGNSAVLGGGGIYCQAISNPTISNNSISGNSAGLGAGLYSSFDSSPSVENCIFAFNSGSEAIWCNDETSVPTLTCCDIYGNAGGDWVGCITDQLGTNGNFSLDPLFCDTAVGDYHLNVISPCAAGNNSCGVLIGALDIGCDHGFVCADANGDSLVNVDDVDFLIDFYFYGGATPCPYLASDLNCDGSVNIADITYLAAYINGTGAPPCCQQ